MRGRGERRAVLVELLDAKSGEIGIERAGEDVLIGAMKTGAGNLEPEVTPFVETNGDRRTLRNGSGFGGTPGLGQDMAQAEYAGK